MSESTKKPGGRGGYRPGAGRPRVQKPPLTEEQTAKRLAVEKKRGLLDVKKLTREQRAAEQEAAKKAKAAAKVRGKAVLKKELKPHPTLPDRWDDGTMRRKDAKPGDGVREVVDRLSTTGNSPKLPNVLTREFRRKLSEELDPLCVTELKHMIGGTGRWRELPASVVLEAIVTAMTFTHGRPREMVELTGADGGPIQGQFAHGHFVAHGTESQYVAALRAARGETFEVDPSSGALPPPAEAVGG